MYIAGLVIPVPDGKMEAYRKWAENGAQIFKAYGCLEIVECWEDNVPEGKQTDFRRAVAAREGEKIVFTWQWDDDEDWANHTSVVTVELSDRDSGTELRLIHEQLPNEQSRDGHTGGWNSALDKLEKFFSR